MIPSTPAWMAALNGTNSSDCRRSSGCGTTGRSRCESTCGVAVAGEVFADRADAAGLQALDGLDAEVRDEARRRSRTSARR